MTQAIKVYLVEDEPLARDELKYLLLRSGRVEIAGEAQTLSEALGEIKRLAPDAVFLDVQLAQGTGLELAQELNALEHPPAVVFATAYDEYALRAFELNAFDYILKPFDEERVRRTLAKIARRLPQREVSLREARQPEPSLAERRPRLAVTADDRILLLAMERILYVAAEEGRVMVHTLDGDYAMETTLIELARKLEVMPFFRAHRAYIVNLDHVTEVQPWFNGTYNLILRDGSKVPVSRTYVKELRQALGF